MFLLFTYSNLLDPGIAVLLLNTMCDWCGISSSPTLRIPSADPRAAGDPHPSSSSGEWTSERELRADKDAERASLLSSHSFTEVKEAVLAICMSFHIFSLFLVNF